MFIWEEVVEQKRKSVERRRGRKMRRNRGRKERKRKGRSKERRRETEGEHRWLGFVQGGRLLHIFRCAQLAINFESKEKATMKCGGLNENGPSRRIDSNVWPPAGGTV